jgi:hypothetical protein
MGVPLCAVYCMYGVCLVIQTRGVILYLLGHFSPSSDMMITAKIWAVYFLCAYFVTGHGGPYGCEMSRLLHSLDKELADVLEN